MIPIIEENDERDEDIRAHKSALVRARIIIQSLSANLQTHKSLEASKGAVIKKIHGGARDAHRETIQVEDENK
jgi:hypothetical protein